MRRCWVSLLLLSASVGLVGVTPARAASGNGCPWPYVCFYLTQSDWSARHPTATYRDMGYWQTLGTRSRGSFAVFNSRNDDGAILHFTDGYQWCLGPNEMYVQPDRVVDKVKIVDSPSCW